MSAHETEANSAACFETSTDFGVPVERALVRATPRLISAQGLYYSLPALGQIPCCHHAGVTRRSPSAGKSAGVARMSARSTGSLGGHDNSRTAARGEF